MTIFNVLISALMTIKSAHTFGPSESSTRNADNDVNAHNDSNGNANFQFGVLPPHSSLQCSAGLLERHRVLRQLVCFVHQKLKAFATLDQSFDI